MRHLSDNCWLTRPEVSERIKVSRKTLAQWATRGLGPKYSLFGGQCRYRLSDLIAWEESQFSRGGAA
ncbi:DNA-binding protein [Mycobacterium sp. ENV421]|uniref:helix-turn-helix transcriptional regulator n=1 Tax=Mycobacterium sp. ENV421 TaxID=1213407 RepID=UPI000C99C44C|nr:helix-turn-helix domain-containing protein [Mycobacterium sp. ENV421]PND55542.1 DNA-binding protein [Mycobacterium sp. ENV421]